MAELRYGYLGHAKRTDILDEPIDKLDFFFAVHNFYPLFLPLYNGM